MVNPFEFGRELGTEELVDRVEDVAAVIQTVKQGAKLFLIGPRRFGKTSILKTAEDRLSTTNAVVLRFDAESYPSLDLLVAGLISAAAMALKGPVERVGDQMRSFFSRLRPELSFNITQESWSAKLGMHVATTQDAHVALLIEALNGLEALAAAQPKNRPMGSVRQRSLHRPCSSVRLRRVSSHKVCRERVRSRGRHCYAHDSRAC